MTPRVVGFSHDIEEKRLNIVIESLVIQEEFGQQTQVLTINLQKEHHETDYGMIASLNRSTFYRTFLLKLRQIRASFPKYLDFVRFIIV